MNLKTPWYIPNQNLNAVLDWNKLNAGYMPYSVCIDRRLKFLSSLFSKIKAKEKFKITELRKTLCIDQSFVNVCYINNIFRNDGSDSIPAWVWLYLSPTDVLVKYFFEEEKKFEELPIVQKLEILGRNPRKYSHIPKTKIISKEISRMSVSDDIDTKFDSLKEKVIDKFQDSQPVNADMFKLQTQALSGCFDLIKSIINKCFN